MKTITIISSLIAVAIACTVPLLVDDYTNTATTSINAVGAYSSDDKSCSNLTSSSQTLSILPGSSKCYYYTNFPEHKPEDAVGGNRSNLEFTLTAPSSDWSFKINIKSWNGVRLADSYTTVFGSAAGLQLVSIPLVSFNGPDIPNLRNIRSFVFESFSDNTGTWKLGKLVLLCATSSSSTTISSSTGMKTSTTTTSKTSSSTKGTPATMRV